MSRDSPVTYSRDDQEALDRLADILHLFHHRNKNQHRHSIWWRQFSLFRRQLNFFRKELSQLNSTPTTHLARTQKKIRGPQLQSRMQDRLSFWQAYLVPKWQHAFSQTTADGRFAVLGLVLVAALAEVCKVTRLTALFEDLAEVEVERVLERFANEELQENRAGQERGGFEDVGEVVGRAISPVMETGVETRETELAAGTIDEDDEPVTKQRAGDSISPHADSGPLTVQQAIKHRAISRTPAKKKRRKGGNAIDDLFAGI